MIESNQELHEPSFKNTTQSLIPLSTTSVLGAPL